MPERYRARHDAGMARHLATGDSHILGRAVELEGLRRDGSVFPIDLSVNDMWIPGGERMFIGMIRDISNRKRRRRRSGVWPWWSSRRRSRLSSRMPKG